MTFAYHVRAMPAWMNPPSPSPPPMPDTPSPPPGAVRPGWWDNKVARQDKDLGGSVLLWVLLAIPALLLLHCCLVRGCFCYDDEEETIGARRIRARLRARRRRRAGELDATDSDRSDSDVEPVSPAAWDAPTRTRSAALSPFHARDGSTGTFTNESIHEWRMLAMERERARARTPGHPSPLGPRDDNNDSDNNDDNNNAPARTRRAHRRVSPEAVEIELESEDDQTEHEPGPMTSRAMATLPRCFVGDNRWRALRGLEPITPRRGRRRRRRGPRRGPRDPGGVRRHRGVPRVHRRLRTRGRAHRADLSPLVSRGLHQAVAEGQRGVSDV